MILMGIFARRFIQQQIVQGKALLVIAPLSCEWRTRTDLLSPCWLPAINKYFTSTKNDTGPGAAGAFSWIVRLVVNLCKVLLFLPWKTKKSPVSGREKGIHSFSSFWRKYYDSIYVVRAPLMLSNVLFEFCSAFSKSVVRKYQCMQRLSTNACSMKQPHFFSIDYKPINVLSMYVYT